MKIIRNKVLPFTGFKAINLFGILFVRKGAKMSEEDINHESIHSEQMKELLYVFFYLFYVIEWLIKVVKYKDLDIAYRAISFEREAYMNQSNLEYLLRRQPFNWITLI